MKLGHTFWSPNTGLIWVLQQLIPTIHLYEEEVWQRFGRWILGHNYFMYTYTVWHRYQSQLSTCTCTVHQTFTLHGLCLATNTHTYTHTYIHIHVCIHVCASSPARKRVSQVTQYMFMSVSEFPGTVLLLGPWCEPCIGEIPVKMWLVYISYTYPGTKSSISK